MGNKVTQLAVGTPCTLLWGRERHQVEILGMSQTMIWTSFPALDVNVMDKGIDVQVGTDGTGPIYHTQVVIGPREPGDGVLLRRTASAARKHARGALRVPTRLQVRYRAGATGPWFEGRIVNLSMQGALLVGEGVFEIGYRVTIELRDKDGKPRRLSSVVVHRNAPEKNKRPDRHWLGLRFRALDPQMSRELTWYLWKRVHRLYPDEMRALYPPSRRRKSKR